MKISICKMISHINNAASKGLSCCLVPKSKLVNNVLEILQYEGYILSYQDDVSLYNVKVYIKYSNKNISVIRYMYALSKPSRCIYFSASELKKKSHKMHRFATVLLSTNRGIMADYKAAAENIGGVAILEVSA